MEAANGPGTRENVCISEATDGPGTRENVCIPDRKRVQYHNPALEIAPTTAGFDSFLSAGIHASGWDPWSPSQIVS